MLGLLIIFLCTVFFFFIISKTILKYMVKIIYYFNVRVTRCFILVAKGDMNEKRIRITGIRNENEKYMRMRYLELSNFRVSSEDLVA
jgi:hypothetical protein